MSATVPTGTTTASRPAGFTGKQTAGLVIGGLLSLVSVIPVQPPQDEPGPPPAILVLAAALGVIGLVATFLAFRTRRRVYVRVLAGVLIINTISSLPAFFVPDVPTWLVTLAGAICVLSVVAVALMLTGPRTDRPAA